MIISHDKRFIFMKTKKTAGTSIEIFLSKFCAPGDIITPISPEDEFLRIESGGKSARNYYRLKNVRQLYWETINALKQSRWPRLKNDIFWQHMGAKEIITRIPQEIWKNYFKFCFVRNPWDRAVSKFYWDKEDEHKGEVFSIDDSFKVSDPSENVDIYSIDGEIVVDYIGRFENLENDLKEISAKIGIPFQGAEDLPYAKGNVRKDRRHYSKILKKDQAEYIARKCAMEIEWFGYQFVENR